MEIRSISVTGARSPGGRPAGELRRAPSQAYGHLTLPPTATQNTSITRIKTQPRHTGMGESKVRVHNALRTTSGVSVQAETLLRVRISRSDESRAAVEDFPVLDKLGLEQIAVARRAFRTARTGAKVPTSHDSIDGPALRFIKSQAYLLQCAHSLPNRSSRL